MAKATAVKQPMTKARLLSAIAEETGLTRRQIVDVIDSLGGQIQRHVKKRGPGTFTLPGLLKIKTVRKPARKVRKGINPFTGEETTFAAKPAYTVVKIQPLKALSAVERFRRLRRAALPLAEAAGYVSDDDVFQDVS